jgi:hypothetical protein
MPMPCKDIQEMLPGYALSELPESDAEKVETHLQSCDGCRREQERIREALGLLSSFRAESPGEPLISRALAAVQAEREGKSSWEERYHNFVYWLTNLEITPARGMLAAACGFMMFFLLLGFEPPAPTAVGSATSKATQCRGNLEKLAEACRRYQAQKNSFPDQLDDLHGTYIEQYPVCPSTQYDTYSEAFLVREAGQPLTLYCSGRNHTEANLGLNEPKLTVKAPPR